MASKSCFLGKLFVFSLCLCFQVACYGQSQWTRADILQNVRQQWLELGDCLEVRLSQTKNGTFDGTEYGMKLVSGASAEEKSSWYFSGNNYFKAEKLLSVKDGEFTPHDVAMLNGDVETLSYDVNGPTTLNLHYPSSSIATISEMPFIQMFHSGLRKDFERLLSKATVQNDILDQEKVVSVTAVETSITWKYYFSTDKVRLLRVTAKTDGMAGECNFTYRDNAKSWMDLAMCTCITSTPIGILESSRFRIHEIIKHASLPDDKFRVARPANVTVVDFAELERRKKQGETNNLVDVAPSVPPRRPFRLGYWLIASAVVVAGGLLLGTKKRAGNRSHSRSGATLIELLVVIAIIGLLTAILLPAVQLARESGRRASCLNHLHQFALASQNFENSHGFLPSNGWGYRWVGDPERGFGRKQPGGWVFHLAPFLEVNTASLRGTTSGVPHITMLKCPSRPSPLLGPANTVSTPFNGEFVELVPRSDYAICEGDFISDTRAGPDTLQLGDSLSYEWTSMKYVSGVSFQRSQVKNSEISDGLSNTYLIGEKNVSSSSYNSLGDLGYDASYFSGVDLDLNRWSHFPPAPDGLLPGVRQFGSAHPQVWGMSFCDGAARFISFTIDPYVHRIKGNRHDGNHASPQ